MYVQVLFWYISQKQFVVYTLTSTNVCHGSANIVYCKTTQQRIYVAYAINQ